MKAVICERLGPPEDLVLRDIAAPPPPGPGQVLIKVAAAGVNFPDTLIIEGRYQLRPTLPFSPGSEVAGTVAALGEGVAGLAVGQRVLALTLYGGFAEQVLADAARVFAIPDAMPFDIAAGFALTYATGQHALR
ncbi:MAG: NADPH:quinone oxidoreductase family protein, partial [Alphaproteobacteria bacterium]